MRHTVGGALFKDDRLLIVKRVPIEKPWPNMWEIPGGQVERNESDKEALQREFFEETKLKINVIKKYHTFEYNHEDVPTIENDYIVSAKNFNVVLNQNEHTKFEWISRNEIKKFNMSSVMRTSVMKVFETLGQ
jgi:8-oxo-dGTP diphosphatase